MGAKEEDGSDAVSVEAFFADTPISGAEVAEQVADFVSRFLRTSVPVVVVTSGGTTVPLERRCVRFIDNFSAGTRGALSTERFLEAGYAVIFLTRTGSLQPFAHMLPAADPPELVDTVACLADEAAATADGGGSGAAPPHTVRIRPQHEEAVARVLAARRRCREAGTLLTIKYETIFQYLVYLRTVAEALRPLGPRAMFYLAAAVSDFYIPWGQLVEHKIQSANGPLELRLHKVPKMLGVLSERWAPTAFMVSFKLETDEGMLTQKATGALRRYGGVHMVVANLLHKRKDEVTLLERNKDGCMDGMREVPASKDTLNVTIWHVHRPQGEPDIERLLVAEVASRHRAFREAAEAEAVQ